jgi:hypothetical protein
MQAQLDEASLVKANAQFWEQMLDMRLEPVPDSEVFCVGPGHLMGSVSLSGMWKGHIEVRLAGGLAQAATAAMLMQPVDTVTEADALDAIREIANIIGGVIKSSLPRPCAMALPESSVATDGLCTRPCAENALAVALRHAAGVLLLRVWEEECGK